MPIHSHCSSISTTLSHNLRLSQSSDDRHTFAFQALQHAGTKVFPMLEQLRMEKGEGSVEYRQAREAVVELLSFICIPYVRNCTFYSTGVANLEQQASKCSDAVVRKKMVSYANQMKGRWNAAEPGGIHHAPRAKKTWIEKEPRDSFLIIGMLLVALCIIIFLCTFHRFTAPSNPSAQADTASDHNEEKPIGSSAPEPAVAVQEPAAPGTFYRYNDERGVLHIVNDVDKVPQRYRQNMEVIPPAAPATTALAAPAAPAATAGDVTKVVIKGDHVVVPVTLRYQGRETQAMLLLDTGATTTSINENVASRLGVSVSSGRPRTTVLADGTKVRSYLFTAESLSVGNRAQPGNPFAILPGAGGDGTEGVLGMSFLKQYRYQVDFKRGIIEWGS